MTSLLLLPTAATVCCCCCWLCELGGLKGWKKGVYPGRLISWGRIGDGKPGSVIVPKTVQYVCTSAFSSKEAFVIRNPLLCEFPKLNPFIMATQQEEEEKREAQNEPKREPSWPSQMNIYIYRSCSSSEREFPPNLWTLVNTRDG